MLYKRSSFLKWLKEAKECDIEPLDNNTSGGVILIKNGPCEHFMGTDSKDLIDYEEIYYICNKKLYIVGLPGDVDLIKVED